jgi:hypothetical protein
MKKLILTSLAILMAISPFAALAGDIYWNAKATFHNDAKFTDPGLRTAKGTATIICTGTDNGDHEWTVTLKFSGLLKNYNYEFQFGVQDQLVNRYDHTVTTDARGKIDKAFTITDLDNTFENISYPPLDPELGYVGYTILRLLDLEGESGGKLLTSLEPNDEEPDDNPYCVCPDCELSDCEYPNAIMVMRARQDGRYGSLSFSQPREKGKK